jgi:hypothetical protein
VRDSLERPGDQRGDSGRDERVNDADADVGCGPSNGRLRMRFVVSHVATIGPTNETPKSGAVDTATALV